MQHEVLLMKSKRHMTKAQVAMAKQQSGVFVQRMMGHLRPRAVPKRPRKIRTKRRVPSFYCQELKSLRAGKVL